MGDVILVTTDFSEISERALPTAARMAKAMGLPVRLFHVIDLGRYFTTTAADKAAGWAAGIAKAQLEPLADRLRGYGARVTSTYRAGLPVPEILEETEDGVALLVVATHGYGPVRRMLLGSTTAKLIQRARVPVLTVPTVGADFSFKRILVPTDLGELTGQLFDEVLHHATLLGAQLALLHIHMPLPGPYASIEMDGKRLVEGLPASVFEAAERDLAALAHRARDKGIACTTQIIESRRRSRTICELAEEIRADLIIMPAHGRNGFERLMMGSVTDEVVRRADVPVLVLKPRS